MTLHPKYITDEKGNKNAVVLPIKEYDKLLEELEDAADVRAYDEAMKNDDGVRIPMEEVFKKIEAKRKKNK
jgi:PHD/YefM family antitoxin component YafN of YafNO toxin-antitoxin module